MFDVNGNAGEPNVGFVKVPKHYHAYFFSVTVSQLQPTPVEVNLRRALMMSDFL